MNKDIKENWAKIIDEIGCLKDKPMTRMLLGNLVRKIRREALANQKKELREKIEGVFVMPTEWIPTPYEPIYDLDKRKDEILKLLK